MANYTISVLSPVKYVPEGFTSAFNSRHIDDYHFEDTILPWEEVVHFAQPWQTGDTISQQVILPYDTVTFKVVDGEGAVHYSGNFTQKLYNFDDPLQKLFEHDYTPSALKDGLYQFVITCYLSGSSTPALTLISNPQDVRDSHPQSLLLQYEHYQFREEVLFETGYRPSLRLLGTLKFDSPGSKRTVYEDQILNTTSLDAKRFRTWKLYCGSEVGIPDYLIDKLEAILGCSDVSIDGRYYTVPEGGKLEPVEEKDYPMRGWNVELRETRQTSGVFTIDLPEVDTIEPHVIDAYVTNEERSKVVVMFSEPLAGYRIPDGELYLNLGHYSVFANVDGATMYIFTNKDYEYGDLPLLTYSGGSIVDKAGNQMAYTENIVIRNMINNPAQTEFTAQWAWSATDPYSALAGGTDTLLYQSKVHQVGANVSCDFHLMPVGYYAVMKEPSTEPLKVKWTDSGAVYNYGVIPDSAFRAAFVVGSTRYYVSRVKMTFDKDPAARVVFSK
jgi:hypothetical protein